MIIKSTDCSNGHYPKDEHIWAWFRELSTENKIRYLFRRSDKS